MDLLTAIESRASAMRMDGPGPSVAELQRILAAGTLAPDHGRLAPWRFVVLSGPDRATLGQALADLQRRNNPEISQAGLDAEFAKAMRAPTVVVVAARVETGHKVPEIEQVMAVAAATQNMILAAFALGYAAMWKTGAAAYNDGVKQAVGLRSDDRIVAFLYLGTATAPGAPRGAQLDGKILRP
jgi:nitroreductase